MAHKHLSLKYLLARAKFIKWQFGTVAGAADSEGFVP